LYQYWY